jgi:hypothetical protein
MFSFLDKEEVLHEKKTAVVGALSRPLLVNGTDRYSSKFDSTLLNVDSEV